MKRKITLFIGIATVIAILFVYQAQAQCTITVDATQCIDAATVDLGLYPPYGGVLSGTATTAPIFDPFTGTTSPATFDPATAGIGTHSLTYTFGQKYFIDRSGPFAPEDISTTGTEVTFTNYDDGMSQALPIGFDFYFFGSTYSSFYLSTNGVLQFTSGSTNNFNTNLSVAPDNIIAFLWDDWDNGMRLGNMKYETIGTTPNRVLIVDYDNIYHYNDASTSVNDPTNQANVQVKLFETTNAIEIHTTDARTSSATQGIKGTTSVIPQDVYLDPWYQETYGIDYYYVMNRYNTDWGYGGNATNDFVAFIPQADCSVTVDVEVVDLPTVDAGLDQEVCYGEMVTLSGAGAGSYLWDNGITDGVAFQAFQTTTYTVTGTDANGCDNTDVVTVTVKPLPVIEVTASSTSICPGDEVTLTATGEATFVWDNGVINNEAFVPASTTTYTVVATGTNFCQTSQEVTVTVNPAQGPVTAASSATTINGGETVILTGSGAATYTWSHGATDGIAFMPNGTTTFELTGYNDFGCTNTDQITVTVIKSDQTITFGPIANKTYDDPSFDPGGTASSGLAVSYSSSDVNVISFSGNIAVITGTGTATITASQSGDGNYNPAGTNVSQTITVIKANQTITFDALADITYDAVPFDITASSTSGLDLVYSSSDEAVVSITGSTATVMGTGTATITASHPGDANYNAATSVSQAINILKADQTITLGAIAPKLTTDAAFDLTGTASSGLGLTYTSSDESVATITGSTVTITGAGTATITAAQAGDNNYNPAINATQTLTVNKADQTITFTPVANKLVTDGTFTLEASASSGLPVSFVSADETVATVAGNTVTIVGAGTATITASQAGDATYNAATNVVQSFAVSKITQTITFDALTDKLTTDAAFDLTATASSGLEISYSSSDETVVTVSGSTLTIVGAGTVTITASQAGDATYSAAAGVSQTFTVVKTDQTITFNAITDQILQDGSMTLGATASSGLDITYKLVSGPAILESDLLTFTGLGTVTIKAMQTGNELYNRADAVEQIFDIVTITAVKVEDKTPLRFYPNPASDFIRLSSDYSAIEIVDLRGVQVHRSADGRALVDISHLRPGGYVVYLIHSDGKKTTHKLLKK